MKYMTCEMLASRLNRHDRLHAVMFMMTMLACFLLLEFMYSLLPHMMPNTAAGAISLGNATCIKLIPNLLDTHCMYLGLPYGAPLTFGLPANTLIAWLSIALHLPVETAYRLAYSTLLASALCGCILLFRKINANKWLAVFGAFLFLASPITVDEAGYGAMRLGFALLPLYVYLDLLAQERFNETQTLLRTAGTWLLLLSTMRSFAMFMDGYSFVMSLLVSGATWALWLFKASRSGMIAKSILAVLVAVVSICIAVLLYRLYIPESHYSAMPIDFFRGQGIDTFMFFVPSASTWLAEATGWHHSITAHQVYSDGPSSQLVYIGYSFIACVVACIWLACKKALFNRKLIITFLLTGAVATLFSLGPSLKFHNFRDPISSAHHISFNDYRMPANKTTLNLHTTWLFQHIPGIKNMRALYRWQLITRLALVIAAIALLGFLLSSNRKGVTIIIGVLLLAETLPPLQHTLSNASVAQSNINNISRELVPDLRANVTPGSKAVFLQLHLHASNNPYLTTYLCPTALIRCYNVGGDKNQELSSQAWPRPIYELIYRENISMNARDIFRSDLADLIIVPFFDLRWQASTWPPNNNFPRNAILENVRKLFPNYDIHSSRWFAYIRPSDSSTNAAPRIPLPLTAGKVASISLWGPRKISIHAHHPIYVWIKTPDAPNTSAIMIGNHQLATIHKEGLVVARLRKVADRQVLIPGTSFPVYLLNKKRMTRQKIGTITFKR